MYDTRIVLTPDEQARLATGHDAAGDPVPSWDLPTLAGAGALRSTVNDLLKFLAANLDSSDALLPRTLRSTHGARAKTGAADLDIGLGWHILRRFDTEIVSQNGETGGYHSFIGVDKRKRLGVVVLTNSAAAIDDIGLHLLDSRFPLVTPTIHTEVAIDPRLLDAYVGRYELAPNFVITVTREDNGLFIQATGQPKFPVFPESDTTFFLKVVDAQITFVKDTSGQVSHLILHQAGRHTPGKKIQ